MESFIAVFALLAGAAAGLWLKAAAQKSERAQAAQRLAELAAELAATRAALEKANGELAASAGFERLAEERQKSAEQAQSELAALRALFQSKQEEAARLLQSKQDEAAQQLQSQQQESAQLLRQNAQLKTQLDNERENVAEKIALLDQAKQTLAHQFQSLAAEILDQKSKNFAEGSQKEIGSLLLPLRTQIDEFRKKVEEAQTDSKTGVAELRGMVGQLNQLNQQLATEANALASALRGSSKAQGDWGEFILRDLLEKAGLREGEQYSFQQVFSEPDEEGKKKTLRTDVVLLMPGGRNLVVDSKVSLTAYTDFANAATDDERKTALKAHLASMRGHLAILQKAGYQNLTGLESPDFVVMFVPVEPAFLLALQADGELWAEAYRQGTLLVGPTTLLYIIRIVNILWRQEQQARNVREVMDRGAALYDKFVGFVGDLEGLGKHLGNAEQSYQGAMKKLSEGRGNLIGQVQKLKDLGLHTSKQIPNGLLERAGVDEPALSLAAEADGD